MKYANEKNLPQGSDGQKIGAFYRLYMDSVGRNKMGYEPILPYLKQIRSIKTREEAMKVMVELNVKGFNTAPYGLNLTLNPFNSSFLMMEVSHGGASLDQEYYAEPNEQQKAEVAAKKSLYKDLLKMVGNSDADAERMMQAEWAIEHRIGVKTLNQVDRRDPMKTIHFTTWEQLLKDFKGIDWVAYRDALNAPKDIDTLNVEQLEPLHEVEKVLAETSVDDLKAYMELKAVYSYCDYLNDAFEDRLFEYRKAVSGVQEQKPRWKRAVAEIDDNLSETIGKLYVAEYFPESSKQRVYRLVKDLQGYGEIHRHPRGPEPRRELHPYQTGDTRSQLPQVLAQALQQEVDANAATDGECLLCAQFQQHQLPCCHPAAPVLRSRGRLCLQLRCRWNRHRP